MLSKMLLSTSISKLSVLMAGYKTVTGVSTKDLNVSLNVLAVNLLFTIMKSAIPRKKNRISNHFMMHTAYENSTSRYCWNFINRENIYSSLK